MTPIQTDALRAALTPPLPDIAHHEADLGDVRLHYASSGELHPGVPIVLLHGFPELWYAWRHQLAAIGRRRHVIAPDLRGYGLSSRPPNTDAYSLDRLVGDIIGLADHLGAPRVALVGHDWGGVIAWHVAMRHPERLARLVIINAPHPAIFARTLRSSPRQMLASAYVPVFRAPFRLAEWALRRGDYALLEQLLRRGLRIGYFSPADAAVYRAAWRAPGAIEAMLAYYRAATLTGSTARVTPTPTTVLWGERDRYLRPELLRGLDRYAPDLRIARVPDASHWIVHERPALVTTTILEGGTG